MVIEQTIIQSYSSLYRFKTQQKTQFFWSVRPCCSNTTDVDKLQSCWMLTSLN